MRSNVRSAIMKTIFITCIGLSALITTIAQGAVIKLAVGQSAFGMFGQTIDADSDGNVDFTFSGQAICTSDIPVSACLHGVGIRGTEATEFFISPSGAFPTPLTESTILGPTTMGGYWTQTASNSVFVGYREYPQQPTASGYHDEINHLNSYNIGFRIARNGGGFHYGWFEVSLGIPIVDSEGYVLGSFRMPTIVSLFREDQLGRPILVAAVPEPSSMACLLAAITLGTLINRSRR